MIRSKTCLKIPWANDKTTMENLWDAAKAVLRGKFIGIQKSQINNLTHHLKELEKEEQTKLAERRL